ncbi:MAG: aminopeptidase P family protein [Atopobiaceae bacterium]|nr:aminopeptidase P family protein [Atopobiaceae bacterium]
MPSTTILEGRLARLRQLMAERGYDAVLLRNNPDLRWLTGAERTFDGESAHTALITVDGQWLHTDSRYYNTFRQRLGEGSIWNVDQDMCDHAEWAADRIADVGPRIVAIEDTATIAFLDELVDRTGGAVELPRLHGDICDLRMVKDEEELALLREAQRITDAAFEHICGYIRPGLTEQQVRVELENYMLTHGADDLSFGTIIAAGPNGASPHAQPGGRVIARGDMIVMDYGALYHDYHADMTRTVCVGEPSDFQREIYDIVRRTHEACAAAIHPGVMGRDIHNLSVRLISEAGYGECYGHGLGHGVGIEIHERPRFSRYYDKSVPAGSVVTVEPGIYLPGQFGIRLEDCGVVTERGYEPFTASSHDLRVV